MGMIPPPPKKRGFQLPVNQVICGSNIEVVSDWPAGFVGGIVTDPPYELGFMGKKWDASGIAFSVPMWKQMLRITKPGGFLFCFGGTRTYHRLACAIEDAGWEIRDCMMWLYGSGFPKSHNISKAIDKKAGAKREVVRIRTDGNKGGGAKTYDDDNYVWNKPFSETTPATELAQLWNGYGTALKPAWEPIIIAMKPLDGTFANNAEKYGVAGLNIDGGRISYQGEVPNMGGRKNAKMGGEGYGFKIEGRPDKPNTQGRWPANLILDEEAGKMLDEQTGVIKGEIGRAGRKSGGNYNATSYKVGVVTKTGIKDSGGASRFFYCAKVSKKERNLGMDNCEQKITDDGRKKKIDNPYLRGKTLRQNNHPTVKPLALIKYLCTLLKTPNQNQIILDPFMGSGTTGMACKELGINFIGIEKEQEYCEIARKRIAAID